MVKRHEHGDPDIDPWYVHAVLNSPRLTFLTLLIVSLLSAALLTVLIVSDYR